MKHILQYIFLIFFTCASALPRDTMTGATDQYTKTLQVYPANDIFGAPVITFGSDETVIIEFDRLKDDREFLRYELIHCNANWQPSALSESEYLDGFNLADIDDFDFSRATTVNYVHYGFSIPNENIQPLVSGNYLVRVFPEDDPEKTIAQARFMVSEQNAQISAAVSSRTDIDYNDRHQQLSVSVNTERSNVDDPFNNLTVMIQQNGRYDNEVALRQPMRMNGRFTSIYEHQPKLIFDAGNEYRRFENVNMYYPGPGVENIEYFDPYYHVSLYPDTPRAENMYLYDQTQNGGYVVREISSDSSETEADYAVVHFSLEAPYNPNARIYIDGDLSNRRFDQESLMVWNHATERYERNMLLKQGAYNYNYLMVPDGESRGFTGLIEGDRFQTDNEYLIKVYARNHGERYDRLIGTLQIHSNN